MRLLLVLLLLQLPTLALASDEAHPHRGHFAPITSAPAPIAVADEEWPALRAGELIKRQKRGEDAGWGAAVQLVQADADTVWDTILAYDRYPDWVDNVETCSVYKTEGDRLWVDMQSKVAGVGFAMYTVNTVKRGEGWMAWTLDYDRKSDVWDNVGYWRVEQLESSPPVTRLDYVTNMKVRGLPGFLAKAITKSALEDGTAWVKQRSEEAAKR